MRRADPGEAWVPEFKWWRKTPMEMACLVGSDLDNYVRLTCHWGKAGNPHAQPQACKASLSALQSAMIKSFRHKGLEAFFRRGSKAGIQSHHAARLRIMLTALDYAKRPEDMNAPGWRFHGLSGELKGFFSVTVNGNWRMIFRFDGKDAELVDYLDHH